MNVFVTVGTTRFDALVNACDSLALSFDGDFTIQHCNPELILRNAHGQAFFDDIFERYSDADIVITHAGAGSIFKLLELGKKILVVPNFDRADAHQSDIARYIEERQFALVAWSLNELPVKLAGCSNFFPENYVREQFFKFDEISEKILSIV